MVKEKENSIANGKKFRFCQTCFIKLIFPNRKGVCYACEKKQKDYLKAKLKGLHDKKLSEFI